MPDDPSTPPNAAEIHVAAAALVDTSGQVLLAKRPDRAHQGGLWEFPGGKLEPGETVAHGLRRELHEELGITISAHRPLIRVRHHYPDRSVLLDIHRVTAWQGEPHGREGQPLAWVSPDALATYPMPPADVPIVAALQLPDEYVITPPDIGERTEFFAALDACLQRGVRLFQLRVFGIPEHDFIEIGREFCQRCHEHDARVFLNGEYRIATVIGADGMHLTSRVLEQHGVPRDYKGPVAASCHSIEQLQHAQSLGVDFAVLSPVLPTRSHPDADPLGWATFAAWVDQVSIPVYALGGMHAAHKEEAWQAGGQGVAGIRGLWAS